MRFWAYRTSERRKKYWKERNMEKDLVNLDNVNSGDVVKTSQHEIVDLVDELKKEALSYAISRLKTGAIDSSSSQEIRLILKLILQEELRKYRQVIHQRSPKMKTEKNDTRKDFSEISTSYQKGKVDMQTEEITISEIKQKMLKLADYIFKKACSSKGLSQQEADFLIELNKLLSNQT